MLEHLEIHQPRENKLCSKLVTHYRPQTTRCAFTSPLSVFCPYTPFLAVTTQTLFLQRDYSSGNANGSGNNIVDRPRLARPERPGSCVGGAAGGARCELLAVATRGREGRVGGEDGAQAAGEVSGLGGARALGCERDELAAAAEEEVVVRQVVGGPGRSGRRGDGRVADIGQRRRRHQRRLYDGRQHRGEGRHSGVQRLLQRAAVGRRVRRAGQDRRRGRGAVLAGCEAGNGLITLAVLGCGVVEDGGEQEGGGLAEMHFG